MRSGFVYGKEYLNRLKKYQKFSFIRNGKPYIYYGEEIYNGEKVFLYRYGIKFYRISWYKGFRKLVWIV